MLDLRDHSMNIYMHVKVLEEQQSVKKCIYFNLEEIGYDCLKSKSNLGQVFE